jgi:hypothetical protein
MWKKAQPAGRRCLAARMSLESHFGTFKVKIRKRRWIHVHTIKSALAEFKRRSLMFQNSCPAQPEVSVFQSSFALCGRRVSALFCASMITMVAVFSLSGCGGSSKPPSVAVTASAASVDGTDAVTLTATVTNDKNSDGVTWSVSGGGTLSNTSTTGATYTAPAPASAPQTVTITATSVADTTKTGTATVTVLAKLTVASTAQNLLGMVGSAYLVQLTSSTGTPPYTWTLAQGSSLPPCLSMNSAGLITSVGALSASCAIDPNVTFDVTDSGTPNAMTASQTLDVGINAAPAIVFSTTTVPPATGTYKVAYTGSVSASGGAGALTYSPNGLPAWLTLNGSTIAGTPTAVGTFNFTVTAADTHGDSAAQAYSITVAPATPTLSFTAIATQTFGSAPFAVSASSASSGAVTYSLTSGQTSAGTVTGAGMVTITGAGTIYLTASQAATADYAAATATTSFTVNPETPTLAFATIPTETFGNPGFQVSASSASSGAVTYSLTAGQTSAGTITSAGMVTMTSTVTIYLTASQTASGNYTAATATTSFVVYAEAPTLSFAAIPAKTFGNAPFTVSASSASSGAVTYSLTAGQTSAGTVTGAGMVTITGAGTIYLTASQAASGNYGPATATTSFTVNPATPTLSFAAISAQTFGASPFQVSASSASSGAVTYSLTTGHVSSGTVTGAGMVTITGVGTIYLTASQAATASYTVATATTTVTVNAEVPTLTFAAIPAKTFGNPAFQASASSASSGAVTYALTAGQTIAGTVTGAGMVTITGAGTIYLTASQAASGNYAAATANTSFVVAAETPTLTFAAIPAKTFGNPAFPVSASSASSGAVTYSLTADQTSAGTVTGAGMVTITGAGTIYLTASQAASGNYAVATATTTVTVNPETPTLSFAAISAKTFGAPSFQASASSASSGAVTYSLTAGQTSAGTVTSAGVVTITGVGTIYLTANQAATADYTAATATTTVAVNPETPALTFAAIPTQTYGNPAFPVSASSASSGAVTYSLTPGQTSAGTVTGAGMVTITGAGTIYLTANQVASGNYAAATATTTVTVNGEVPALSFAAIPTHVVGDASFQVSASSASSGAVTYSLTPGQTSAGTVTGAGMVTITGAGTIYLTANQAVSGNYAAATATTTVTVNPALSITTASPLPTGVVGNAYSQQIKAGGGIGPYTWTIISGATGANSLQSVGLTFTAGNATLAGTAGSLAAGSATFTVQVADSASHHVQATLSVTINASLTITTATLSPAYATTGSGSAYSTTLTALGGSGGDVWSVTVNPGGLAALGLGLNSSTGVLSGSAGSLAAGSATFTVQVKDSNNTTATQQYTINVYSPPALPAPNPGSLPGTYTIVAGSSYNGTINVSGGSGNYSWSVTGLSDSLSATPNGNTVTISGTPGSVATVTFNVKVTDTTTGLSATQNGYTIAVNEPTPVTLPSPNPTSLPSGTQGQSYSGAINASGGVGSYTWTINGVMITNQGSVALTDGISATNTGGSTLSISASTLGSASSVTLTNVKVTDSLNSTASQTYTISTPPPGSQVSGQVSLSNGCGGNNVPVVTIKILTNPGGALVQSTTTDDSNGNGTGNGSFSFASVPAGNFTITPSISGPTSLFFPASQSLTLSGSTVNNENFTASLGYTISGTATYSGAQTGQVYLNLNGNCGGGGGGPSISEATLTGTGAFSIRGVPPGTYTLQGWMDTLGQGTPNATNPTGSASVTVTNANVTIGQPVTLANPTFTTPAENPTISAMIPNSQGVFIEFSPSENSKSEEDANQYVVQWSTSSTLGGGSGGYQFLCAESGNVCPSHTFAATGDNGVWVLNNAVLTGSGFSFTPGQTYYFQARSFDTLASTTHPSGWCNYTSTGCSGTSGFVPVTIATPPCTVSCTTVSSSVTIPAGITVNAGAPLYLGLIQLSSTSDNPIGIYVTEIANPVTAHGAYDFTITVPSGPNYAVIGILDQNNTGGIGAGAITNVRNKVLGNLTIAGSTQTVPGITLPTANSTATVTTQFNQSTSPGGSSTNYNLNFEVEEVNKLPVSVTLMSGPNLINPVDIGNECQGCGSQQFQYSANIGSTVPKVGDTYTFNVKYSDATSDTVSGTVTTVLDTSALPTLISPTGTGIGDTPNFDWTYPASAGSYTYQFSVCCGNNGSVWNIPANNSNSNGFSSSQITPPLLWDKDPTNQNNLASPSSLSVGAYYSWSLQAKDSNGNSAQAQMNFETATGPVSLPAANSNPLPSGVVGVGYSGTLNASGGPGGGNYYYQVNGTTIPTDMSYVAATNSDGLTFANSGGNTLWVGGSPASPESVSLTIEVFDTTNSGDHATVTYTVVVGETPLSMSPPVTNSALINFNYSQLINASGGSGSGDVFTVAVNGGAANSVPLSPSVLALTDGLSASSYGDGTIAISGIPNAPATISLAVSVTDSQSNNAGPVTYTIDAVPGPSSANNKYLSGTYVCKFDGFNDGDGSRWTSVSSFKANGAAGTITSGMWDMNSRDLSSAMSGTMTGAYSIGADNNGWMSISSTETSGGSGTHNGQYAIALNNTGSSTTATEFRMVEIDDLGQNQSFQHGTGDCFQATTSVFGTDVFTGNSFVFDSNGENGSGTPQATVGRFVTSGGGVTGGVVDEAKVSDSSVTNTTLTGGSYTTPDATNGRSTLTFTVSGGSVSSEVYVIDANRMFMIQTTDAKAQSGDVRKQQQATYSGTNLSGPFVLYTQAYDGSGYESEIQQGTGNGVVSSGIGSATINQSYADESGTYAVGDDTGGPINFTFDSTNPGRTTVSAGSNGSAYMYFFNNNSALMMDFGTNNGGFLETGWLEPQSQTTFTYAAVAGTYLFGGLPQMEPGSNGGVGEFILSSCSSSSTSCGLTGGVTTGGEGDFSYDQSIGSGTYNWDTTVTGTGSFLSGTGSKGLSCMVISATKDVCIFNGDDSPSVAILQQ